MSILYHLTIELTKEKDRFTITWENKTTPARDWFTQAIDVIPAEILRLWQQPRHQLELGEKLFHFLDGDAAHLKRALTEAKHLGESLYLHLITCKEVADWPFELLALDGEFLVPSQVHVVRQVSEWGAKQTCSPQKRPLRMLFMACSAVDVKPELDFEREEEAIFQITEHLAIQMEVEDSGSLAGLKRKLEIEEYDVLHLSCLADIDPERGPYLMMESETGHSRQVFPEELWHEALVEHAPRLLFLSCCSTGLEPDDDAVFSFAHVLVEKYHVPAVLGWGRSVSDDQAIHAGKIFYHELSRGVSILDAVKRSRLELIKEFADTTDPAWPLLRMFSDGRPLNAIVTEGQPPKTQPRNMVYTYLGESNVQVLKEGFVGRRRQLQQSLSVLTQAKDKIGVLILGMGGLGKSCLAGKISERFFNHSLIIVCGKLDENTMQEALRLAFTISQDKKGQQILSQQKMTMAEKLANLCAKVFLKKNYIILLDDFEQNVEGWENDPSGRLRVEAADLLSVLLQSLAYSGKMTQLIITSRYDFSITIKDREVVAEKLKKIWLTGFREAEQFKKQRQLLNILNYEFSFLVPNLFSAGLGNPRLMEEIDELVKRIATEKAPQLLASIKNKQEEFIRKHLLRQLLHRGGEELKTFFSRFSIYRKPVQIEGVRQVSEKIGLGSWQELLKMGMGLSLIEFDQTCQTYQVTPHLREELLSTLPEPISCHHAAFLYYKAIRESQESMDHILAEEYIYHALKCGEDDAASELGGRLVKHFRDNPELWESPQVALQESRRVALWVLGQKKKEPANEHDALLLSETAATMKHLGEYDTAVSTYEQTLAIHRNIHGENHHTVVMDLNNLGAAWGVLAQPQKAMAYYEAALNIADQMDYASTHPDMMGNLWNNLGTMWNSQRDYKKALAYFLKALTSWETMAENKNLQIASVKGNLGAVYANLGRYEEAVKFYSEALDLDRLELGEKHPDVAVDLNNLGTACFDLGQRDKAIEYYEEAVTLLWEVYARPHVTIAVALSNLGKAYLDMPDVEKKKEAKKYYKMALIIFDELFGSDNDHSHVIADLLAEIGEG